MLTHHLSLPIIISKEGKFFVAYTPALDLAAQGKTVPEAKKNFQEVIEIFFEELEEKGTTDEVLTSLGWERIDRKWIPPSYIEGGLQEVRVPAGVA